MSGRDAEPIGLDPWQLLEVLANIDTGTKSWRRKTALMAIIGRYPHGHRISVRALGERAGISPHLTQRLMTELIEARIVWAAELGAGTRATAWVLERRLEVWRDVPWRREVHAVRLFTFHDEHARGTTPGQTRVSGSPSRGKRSQPREGASNTRVNGSQPREGAPDARDSEIVAARHGGVRGALERAQPQEEVPTHVGGQLPTPPPGDGGGRISDASEGWRAVRHAVKTAARAPFIAGEPERRLHDLWQQTGTAWVLEQLPTAPPGLGLPRMVGWLEDQRHGLDDEYLEGLRARAVESEPELGPGPGPEPVAASPYREYVPEVVEVDPATRAAGLAMARAARAGYGVETMSRDELEAIVSGDTGDREGTGVLEPEPIPDELVNAARAELERRPRPAQVQHVESTHQEVPTP